MRRSLVFCLPDEVAAVAWQRMQESGYVRMPVIDGDGRPLGVLAARDVLEVLLREIEHEEALLRDFVMGIGYR